MAVKTEGNYLGDWLKAELFAPNFCREETTVLVPMDLVTGQVLGIHSALLKYAPYDNTQPAAAAGVLVDPMKEAEAKLVTSIVVLTNVGTVTTPVAHGLIVGDAVRVSGATGDLQLNDNYAVATAPTATTFTIVTVAVGDDTYDEATLRLTKLNQPGLVLARGPAIISKAGLNWGASDAQGIIDGVGDLKAVHIIVREGV